MTAHSITWTLGHYGRLTGEARCTASEGADCRLTGNKNCQCEAWDEILRDEDGMPYHLAYTAEVLDGEDGARERHYMHDQGECNVVLFLDDSDIDEIGPGHDVVIGTIPVNAVWDDTGYIWEPATEVQP